MNKYSYQKDTTNKNGIKIGRKYNKSYIQSMF